MFALLFSSKFTSLIWTLAWCTNTTLLAKRNISTAQYAFVHQFVCLRYLTQISSLAPSKQEPLKKECLLQTPD